MINQWILGDPQLNQSMIGFLWKGAVGSLINLPGAVAHFCINLRDHGPDFISIRHIYIYLSLSLTVIH
jgi:hypothetical protein